MKTITNIMPVGAPWGGPESMKFLSCFTSAYMHLEKIRELPVLFCDQDDKICNKCGKCGTTVWENKTHQQIYHTFLTLSGISCCNVWPKDYASCYVADNPLAYKDDEYIKRTMTYAGYSYDLLSNVPEMEMRKTIIASIDNDIPVLAYNFVNNDWSLITGYDLAGNTLFGKYVPENWDDTQRKPEFVENDNYSKSNWYHDKMKLLVIIGRKAPSKNYSEVFPYLIKMLQQAETANGGISGLSAFDACISALLDDEYVTGASDNELTKLYTLTHAFIGVLAESRCFAAFAFWAGFFGRITDENTVKLMKKIGDYFMDTHNQCWGAWAAMGQDHRCQPELYVDRFCKRETREKVADYIGLLKANDEKAISVLHEIIS